MTKKSARTVAESIIIDDNKIQPSEYQHEDVTGYSAATSSNA
jgi:hypothetical protein